MHNIIKRKTFYRVTEKKILRQHQEFAITTKDITTVQQKGNVVMKMEKRHLRIGQIAKELGIEKFVIRFWEKEFGLKPQRSSGGQRFYEQKDVETFVHIKKLLYEGGYTIAGAKKQLHTKEQIMVQSARKTTITEPVNQEFFTQLQALQKQLLKLKELL